MSNTSLFASNKRFCAERKFNFELKLLLISTQLATSAMILLGCNCVKNGSIPITKRKDQTCPHWAVVNNLIKLLIKLTELPALAGREYQVRLFRGTSWKPAVHHPREFSPAGVSSSRSQTPWAGCEHSVSGTLPRA